MRLWQVHPREPTRQSRRKFDRELEVCEIARRILSFCHYGRAAEHFCYARPSSRPDVVGLRRGGSSFFFFDLAHPLGWYEEVYRRGLSGASGCFVFEAREGLADGGLVVLAARQGGGCSLRLAHAPARQERGTWEVGVRRTAGRIQGPAGHCADDYYRLALWRRVGQSLL